MALPRNVQAQVEAADALLVRAYPPQNSETEAPSLEALAKLPTPSPEPSPTVPATPAVNAPVEPASTPPPTPDSAWEQKYKTLQGLFNKEVPGLQQQVRQLTEQGQQTARQLETLLQTKAAPPEPRAPEVDPRDVESFGSDLVEMVQRITQRSVGDAAGKLDAIVQALNQRFDELEQVTQGTSQAVAVSAEDAFFGKLTKTMPSWEVTNASDGFLAWLATEDPVYGASRQSALDAAQSSLNADRAVAVFKAYESTLPAPPTPPKTNSLDRQVSPSSVATPEPTVTADGPMLTQKQITDFYADVSRGRYRGREDEQQRTEQIINQAIAVGRVR